MYLYEEEMVLFEINKGKISKLEITEILRNT